jgi:hypothetical protein
MPIVFAAVASGTKLRPWWSARRKATANNSNSSKVHRREGLFSNAPIKPDIFALPR